jgi:MFS family permease
MTSSRYRWVIVAAGGLLGCVAIGGMFSLPVLLQPIARDTGWSVTGVSSAMTIGFLAMALTSMIWGTLSDRLGPLPVVLTGSVVIAASLVLASFATSLAAFQFIFGVMVGGATAAIFAPMMATVTGWFDSHRSLAVSLVSAGMGMAPMTMSPLVAWLVSNHDWRTSMQILAGVVAAIMIPVSLLVRRAPALEVGPSASSDDIATQPEMSMAGSLGMATGPVAGGLIYDTFGSYAWLYIGSWAVGLGAFLIALTFRPMARAADRSAPVPA